MGDIKMITKMEPVNYLIIDFNEYPLSEIIELMDILEECDGIFRTTAIGDGSLRDSLELRGVTNTNARGGSYRGSGYRRFCDEINEVIGWERL